VSLYRLYGLILFGLFLPLAADAAPLPTNMDLVFATLEQTVDQALLEMGNLEPGSPAGFLVQPQTKHAANWMVDHILAARLLARGFAVSLDSTAAEPGNRRLEYRILDLGINGRAGLRGGKIDRQSRATLAFTLSQGDTLRWQGEFQAVKRDRIPRPRVDLLGNAAYSFAQTKLEEKNWSTFVEPMIISTVLGGLIYLFFSNR
jgi:hypothetical protein